MDEGSAGLPGGAAVPTSQGSKTSEVETPRRDPEHQDFANVCPVAVQVALGPSGVRLTRSLVS